MRVNLLATGMYMGMEDVVLPAEVEAITAGRAGVEVTSEELIRVGANPLYFTDTIDKWIFILGEYEIVEE